MKSCDQGQGVLGRCAQCDTLMAAQEASRWWCTEVCFEEWQTQRWSPTDASVRALAPEMAKPR